MIDNILFDLDDTLLVELKSAEDSFIVTIKQVDSGIPPEEFVRIILEENQWREAE